MAYSCTTVNATALVAERYMVRAYQEELELATATPARRREILAIRKKRGEEWAAKREAQRIKRERPIAEMWLSIYAPDQVYDPAIHFIPEEASDYEYA